MAERNLWAERQVGESGVVNSFRYAGFAASPMGAGVKSESEPAVEIIGHAGAGAARIRFQSAAQRQQCSWKLAVDCRAGIKHGVSAEQLPLRRRLRPERRRGWQTYIGQRSLPQALPGDGQGGSLIEITCEYSSELSKTQNQVFRAEPGSGPASTQVHRLNASWTRRYIHRDWCPM